MTHPGSLYFKEIIAAYRDTYRAALTRGDKISVTKHCMDYLSQRCNFLKLNAGTRQWEPLDAVSIRDKIGHALRFAARQKGNTTKSKSAIQKKKIEESLPAPAIVESTPIHVPCLVLSVCPGSVSTNTAEDIPRACSPVSVVSNDSDVAEEPQHDMDDDDLEWILRMPLLEEDPLNNQIYFVEP